MAFGCICFPFSFRALAEEELVVSLPFAKEGGSIHLSIIKKSFSSF